MKVSYQWLTEYLGDNAPSSEKIADLLTFHAFEIDGLEAVNTDMVLDIDVLPNRSSDCLSHRGIAREIATLRNMPLAHDPLATVPVLEETGVVSVTIESTADCPRFSAAVITGVAVGESPQWLKDRLETIGQRSINNIVDATNYVMYAIGQPLHAYDADLFPQVNGVWQFGVRRARAGETVSLLAEAGKNEDRVIELTGSELLIVDESSDVPIGLAGVKGGRYAGVHDGTTKIIVEAAHFDPILTRKTARGLGIVIDASKRFENEPARELPLYAQAEIIKLITDIAGGTCEGVLDAYLEQKANPTVVVRQQNANHLLGLSLTIGEMEHILVRTGSVVTVDGDSLHCTGPFERTDLHIEEDFIEEIGRVYGYDKVAAVIPESVALTELNARHYYSEQVRTVLIEQGASEVITSSFRKKDIIQLQNALASDKSCLRSSLRQNITDVLDQNALQADLLGAFDTRVFEIGTVFRAGDAGVTEQVSLAIGVRTKPSGYSGKEDKILQELLRVVDATLGTTINWTIEKGIAECNFTEVIASLPVPTAYDPVTHAAAVQYVPFSVYPAVSRDIALWVSEGTTVGAVENTLNESAGELRVRTTLFDEFTKVGRTSYAFRLVFQSNDKTLTDSEVNKIMDSVYDAVAGQGWEVR